MDFGHYADGAVTLANSDLDDLDDVRSVLAGRDWLLGDVDDSDLRPLRRLRADLNAVFDAASAGDERRAVELLNDLLERHPVRPRISGHDTQSWHLHVNDRTASVAATITAESVFGLTLIVTELGADRLGRCAAETCGAAFLDSSATRSKRFCSSRCATRTNVAAYRQRRQADTATAQ